MKISELSSRAIETRIAPYARDAVIELLVEFEQRVSVDPREPGLPLDAITPSGSVWVYESPPFFGLPRFVLTYAIDDEMGEVNLLRLDAVGPAA